MQPAAARVGLRSFHRCAAALTSAGSAVPAADVAAAAPAAPSAARGLASAGPDGAASAPASATSAASLLDELVDWERAGIPAAAGTSASSRFELGRMRRLLGALGDPHTRLRVVHVAGSKGKGSTVTLLASMLTSAGYRTGVYTSPHVVALEERVAVGRRPIAADDLAFLLATHGPAIRARAAAEGGALSHFEVLTALAFRYFADCSVDVAVVETGLGGVTDATNVFPAENLEAAVITPLGLEHVEALGGSIASIARAKAGILRPGRPLVMAPQVYPEAEEVLVGAAAALGCPLVRPRLWVRVEPQGMALDPAAHGQALRERLRLTLLPDGPEEGAAAGQAGPGAPAAAEGGSAAGSTTAASTSSSTGSGSSAGSGGSGGSSSSTLDVTVGLAGPHQHVNVATAVAAARLLRRRHWHLPDWALAEGLAAASLPGRFQVVKLPGGPQSGPAGGAYVVLDGAHTAESAAALAAAVRAAFPRQPLVLVLAMAADKDHAAVVRALRALQPRVAVFTSVPIAGSYARAAAPGTLVGQWQAAAITAPPGERPFRCRELLQASLGAAFDKAQAELRGLRVQGGAGGGSGGGGGGGANGPGVILVTGSLHAVAAAHRLPDLRTLLSMA